MCDLPPCPPCPPNPPAPCPQVCPGPPRPAPCIGKPEMRGLHWKQTKGNITAALAMSAVAGFLVYFFIGRTRRAAYKDFYAKAELEDWADDMARKGLFQAVPAESLREKKKE